MAEPALRITEIPQRVVVRLKSYALTSSADSIPSRVESAGVHFVTLAPGEWWMVSDTPVGAQVFADVGTTLDSAIIDISCAVRALRVDGRFACDLLAKGCGLDLHPRSFPPGSATRTRLAQLVITLERLDLAHFELYVARSHRAWLRAWLDDAALEFQ